MKKHDKINLDSMSNLDEKIIDEVTDKKIALSVRARSAAIAARRKFIAIGGAAASFILIFTLFFTLLAPIIGLGQRTVPVYQGMTIRQDSAPTLSAKHAGLSSDDFEFLSESNGNAYGHDKKEDTLEKEIEDIVNIDVVTDEDVKYYVQPNETFIIEVHISNPDNYEIQSFTLNGKKYANYMFKEGSTMELLLLEVTAPETSGYVEYTIDAIKYIDGTEIKDVDMSSGNKSIKAGIAYPTAPFASVTETVINTTSVEFSLNIEDPHSLIGGNELAIYLSDGESIVASQKLTLGENTVKFEDLLMSKKYEYGIVAVFDMADGRDIHKEWLLTAKITTLGAYGIENVVLTQDSVSFEAVKVGEVGTIKSVSIYDAATNELVETLTADAREFKGLLSNHAYNLFIDYSYVINGEEINDFAALEVKTSAKTAPVLTFGETTSTQTSINYAVDVIDIDNLLNVQKVEILLGDESVKDNGTSLTGTFDSLLSNNKYTVKVTCSYDLNDGAGVHTETVLKEITTLAKTAPTLTFGATSSDQTSINYTVGITDVDNLLNVQKVEILLGDESVKDNGTSLTGTFDSLLSNNKYTVKVTYSYDLNDGAGVHTETVKKDITTVAKTAPTLTFGATSSDQTSINYTVGITDVDNLLNVQKVEILLGENSVKDNGKALTGTFDSLLSNNKYTVKVTYSYDLNDGAGVHTETVLKEITTLAKAAPTLTFGATSSDQTSINYAVGITDVDNLLNVQKVEILLGENSVKDNGKALTGTFDSLLSNNKYTVKVTYSYDLNDGAGVHTETVLKEITTLAKAAPTFTFTDIDITDVKIAGKINMIDPDSLGTVNSVDIYKGDQKIATNAAKELDFTELEYYTDYQIRVAHSYNLNDGKGVQSKVATYDFKTAPHLAFNSFEILNTSEVTEGETIFLQVNITNPNNVVYKKIVVNGKEYDVSQGASNSTLLICNILNNGQFEGGETALTIEKVISELGGKTYTVEPQSNNTSSIFIYGKLEVKSMNWVIYKNGSYVPADANYVFPSDQARLQIEFNNKSGYNIDSVTIGLKGDDTALSSHLYDDDELTKLDNEHYLVEALAFIPRGQMVSCNLTKVTYSIESTNRSLTADISSNSICELASDEVKYIQTAADLLNMNGSYYYELANDIDISEEYTEWQGAAFSGVFNGKDHSIKNMSYIGTPNHSAYIGLFSQGSGIIENLNLESAKFAVNYQITDTHSYHLYLGCIVGAASNMIINNCSVDENSFISISSNAPVYANVGGIAGTADRSAITNCVNNATITGGTIGGGAHSYCGGIVGYCQTYSTISDCANNGAITAKDSVGGITGGASSNTMITNCINNSAVKGREAEGIIGYPGAYVTVANCVNNDNITMCTVSANDRFYKTINCYSIGKNATVTQLNSKKFYTETLGWDETVWNLDDLDIENGKYPTLR